MKFFNAKRHAPKILTGRPIILLATLLVLSSCASKLEKDKVDRALRGDGQAMDISKLMFTEVESGEPLSLRTYMERENKEFVLLMFGSMACSNCNKKNEYIRDEIVGKHPLYLKEAGKAFGLVGVNTDVERAIESVKSFRLDRGFNFIRLTDPRGKTLVEHLMPEGDTFSVPFIALMTKRGMAWRYTNQDHVEVAELLARVSEDMGLDATGLPAPKPNPEPVLPPPPQAGLLQIDFADRLRGVGLADCNGQDVGALSAHYADVDVRFVLAAQASCDAACEASAKQLQDTCATGAKIGGRSCQAKVLFGNESTERCTSLNAARGGKEFFSVFESFFDWQRPRTFGPNGSDVNIAPGPGLMTLGFDRGGALVFAKEGALTGGEINQAMSRVEFGKRLRGPDFSLYGSAGDTLFGDVRSAPRFTMMYFFDVKCAGCVEELQEWSRPGGFNEYCGAHPSECRVTALEDQEDYLDRPHAEYYRELLEGDGTPAWKGLDNLGVSVPLFLDAVRTDPANAQTKLPRFYDGYFLGRFGHDGTVGGAVVWDREGKLVDFVRAPIAGGAESVFERVKLLIEQYARVQQSL